MKTIRFTEKQPPYMAGDVAGFEDDVADRYVAEGVAETVETGADDESIETSADAESDAAEQPRRKRRRQRG